MELWLTKIDEKESRTHNSRFAKSGVSCFYDSGVMNSSFVHLMKFTAENPAFAKLQTVTSYFKITTMKL